ncbi:cell wall-binding protein [uncultured Clostridium sp.]|uniref:cell wall-binding protein n=1 Tax=uncultured Clostridium sp. TaxID=59620 RepID=UPI0025F51AFC|nr:cell wall-binding protein [uncultured Clostridium sp.]
MKLFKKLVVSFIAMLSLIAINPGGANAEWKSNNSGWWYTEGSTWATGWKYIDGNWYYFYSDGYMDHDCLIGNYYLNSNGAWTTDVPSSTSSTSSTSSSYSNSTSSSSTSVSNTVYVSNNGIYHSTSTAHGMKSSIAMSRNDAIAKGYTACKICK